MIGSIISTLLMVLVLEFPAFQSMPDSTSQAKKKIASTPAVQHKTRTKKKHTKSLEKSPADSLSKAIKIPASIESGDSIKTKAQAVQPDSTKAKLPAADSLKTAQQVPDPVRSPLDTLRKLPNNAFGVGEHLHYDVKYGFINAGDATMMIGDTLLPNGRKCYHILFNVDSKPVFNWVYHVYDRYSTIVDAVGLFPWRFEQHINEGGFHRDFTADFDQLNHIAKTSEKDHPIPPYVHDIMSAFYFARTIDYAGYRPGQLVHFQNFYKDSTYDLDVKYKGRQQIEVPAGKFNCIIVEPIAKECCMFKSNGRVLIWLSDDDRKIPIKVSAQIPIGSVDSELVDFQGVNGPITAKVED